MTAVVWVKRSGYALVCQGVVWRCLSDLDSNSYYPAVSAGRNRKGRGHNPQVRCDIFRD